MAADIRNVIVVPGKVAYVTPEAKTKFTNVPKAVLWNDYLEELLTVHQDIEVVSSENKSAVARPTETTNQAVRPSQHT